MDATILIIEDDPHIAEILDFLLRSEHYYVLTADTGEAGLDILNTRYVDLIVADINLPGIDGFDFCRHVKAETSVPVILLSCRDTDQDVINGLEIGADDYIKKPFNHKELILRVNKIIERVYTSGLRRKINSGNLFIDLDKKIVSRCGEPLHLTNIEFKVLSCLLSSDDWITPWQTICKMVWGTADWEGGYELVKVSIRRLRRRIEEDPTKPRYIINEWGRGYRFQRIRTPT